MWLSPAGILVGKPPNPVRLTPFDLSSFLKQRPHAPLDFRSGLIVDVWNNPTLRHIGVC